MTFFPSMNDNCSLRFYYFVSVKLATCAERAYADKFWEGTVVSLYLFLKVLSLPRTAQVSRCGTTTYLSPGASV